MRVGFVRNPKPENQGNLSWNAHFMYQTCHDGFTIVNKKKYHTPNAKKYKKITESKRIIQQLK